MKAANLIGRSGIVDNLEVVFLEVLDIPPVLVRDREDHIDLIHRSENRGRSFL